MMRHWQTSRARAPRAWGIARCTALCAVGLTATGCGDDESSPFNPAPMAALRFVNAVPDTMALDYRIVTSVVNTGMFEAPFRSHQRFHQPVRAGAQTIRVFLSSTNPEITSTVVGEAAFTFEAGKSYTFLHAGYMRGGAAPAVVTTISEDAAPVPAAGRVAVRVLNLAAGQPAIDVYVGTDSVSALPSAAPQWTATAFGAATPYVEVDTGAVRVAVTATTTTTALVANTAVERGAPPVGTTSAIPGVRIAGSALTIVVLPPSTPGSRAPQTAAFQAPTVVFLVDRRPPE